MILMIQTQKELDDLLTRAMERGVLAIDTEFVWERTYYPNLGLVQLGTGEDDCAMLDVLKPFDMTKLCEVISDGAVVKILHDAVQDLTILKKACDAYPSNVFDTKLAGGFARLTCNASLQRLVNELCGIHLPKTSSRTDWLKRPLDDHQLEYALDDVRYLPSMREKIIGIIGEYGDDRIKWLEEELSHLDDRSLYEERDPRLQYLRVKGGGKCYSNAGELSALREITAWREKTARSRNLPRGHVVPDEQLVKLVKFCPTKTDQLRRAGLSEKAVSRYGKDIIHAIGVGMDNPVPLPPKRKKNGEDERSGAVSDFLFAYVKGKAMAEGIDPALIASRSDLSAIASSVNGNSADLPVMRGWRKEFVGNDLVAILAGEIKVAIDKKTGLPISAG